MPAFEFNEANLPATEDDISFDDILARHPLPPEFSLSTANILLVDHVPIVDPSKEEKLKAVIAKIFKPHGTVTSIHLPRHVDPTDKKTKTKGYAFVTLETEAQAAHAMKALDGHKMDKVHVWEVCAFSDVEKYEHVEEDFVEPEIEPFEQKEHLRSWLADPQGRDQWAMLREEEVAVYFNQKAEAPEHVYSRHNWTETYVQWSPLGTYLCTFHRQGVALWGGASWSKIVRFYHPGVKLIHFSPRTERYLVTWSNEPINSAAAAATGHSPFTSIDDGHQIVVWDVRTGRLLRSFPGVEGKLVWPVFKWSATERYFARCQPGAISVYEAPSMGLLDKKSIKVEGVKDFEWTPHADLADMSEDKRNKLSESLAFWTPEVGNQPARVTVMAIPSRDIIRTKNLFNVNDCKLYWQSHGDYLCVKVDRFTKTRKSIYSSMEIFHIKEKDIPVEVVELKDVATTVAWEPKSDRLCVISTADATVAAAAAGTSTTPGAATSGGTPRTTVTIYGPDRSKGKDGSFRVVKLLEKKTMNAVYWSPKGRHMVLATLRSQTTWDIEFWDLDFEPVGAMAVGNTAVGAERKDQLQDPGAWCQLLSAQESYGVTDIEWDPTGRFVLTSASAWRHTMENGFALWDFSGKLQFRKAIERFKQILWRPRPPTRLSKDQMKTIRKNLKEYSAEFEKEDTQKQTALSAAALAHRQRLVEEWNAWRYRVEKELEEERIALDWPRDDEDELVEEWVKETEEEIIEEVVVEGK
jgi:translation initiation factor 3 subunit B